MPRKTAEGRREYQARYYRENKERLNEAHKKWREENPEKVKEMNARASKKYRDSMQNNLKVIQPDLATALRGLSDSDK